MVYSNRGVGWLMCDLRIWKNFAQKLVNVLWSALLCQKPERLNLCMHHRLFGWNGLELGSEKNLDTCDRERNFIRLR